MNVSNILPSIRYGTGAGSQLNIDVQPTRTISARLRIRPKSHYEQKLLNAALMQAKSGIVLNPSSQQTFSIGGVKVLSRRFSHISNANDLPTTPADVLNCSADSSYLPSHLDNPTLSLSNNERNLMHTIHSYRSNQTPSPVEPGKEESADILQRHSIANRSRRKSNFNNSSSENHVLHKGKPAIMHTRNCQRPAKNGKLTIHKNSNSVSNQRISTDENSNGKPEFTTSNAKATKIYLSQKQSADIISSPDKSSNNSSAHPSAPPCTPRLEMKKKYEYVPSLSDNLAKQQIKAKLKSMKKVETEKEKVRQAGKMKIELKEAKEREQELRKQQRKMIYLLNTAMTKVENDQFEKFKAECGLQPKEYPSHSQSGRKK